MSGAWEVSLTDEAKIDYAHLDGNVRKHVAKMLHRVAQNPLPTTEGGYGKPLGDRDALDLAGLLKIKLRDDGVRIIYRLERAEGVMRVIVIGMRADGAVYREALRRRRRHDL